MVSNHLPLRDSKRYCFLLLSLLWATTPALATRRVTGDQLEQELRVLHNQPDATVARELFDLDGAEQLSPETLSRCEALAPGKLSRQALLALFDKALFLDPSPAVLPADPSPDHAAQAKMITLTVEYVTKTVHQLPNFFATRVATSFQDNSWYERPETTFPPEALPRGFNSHEPLHPAGRSAADIQYRQGEEVVHGQENGPRGLTTSGEFGPILGTVLLDAAQGKLAWSRWEQYGAGRRAVFRFSVAAEKSHFDVGFCCILRSLDEVPYVFHQLVAYDGEFAIDPVDGTILRLSLKATGLKRSDPILQARILVEYGPVELGGRTYICPLKGVALSVGLEVRSGGPVTQNAPLQTLLNDIAFEHYHVTRSSVRVLPGSVDDPAPMPPQDNHP